MSYMSESDDYYQDKSFALEQELARLRAELAAETDLSIHAQNEIGQLKVAVCDANTALNACIAERDALLADLADRDKRLSDLRRPTHGPCCTCQRCGKNYDDCRCDLDEVVDELASERERSANLRETANEAGSKVERLEGQLAAANERLAELAAALERQAAKCRLFWRHVRGLG